MPGYVEGTKPFCYSPDTHKVSPVYKGNCQMQQTCDLELWQAPEPSINIVHIPKEWEAHAGDNFVTVWGFVLWLWLSISNCQRIGCSSTDHKLVSFLVETVAPKTNQRFGIVISFFNNKFMNWFTEGGENEKMIPCPRAAHSPKQTHTKGTKI